MASSMVDFLKSRDLEGADLLEVGGGVGAIQIDLLKAGLAKRVNVELSSGYDDAAQRLAEAEGVEDRITRRHGDFVEHQDEFEKAAVVLMNRVVCCYPWMERMMEAAVGKADRYLALVFPGTGGGSGSDWRQGTRIWPSVNAISDPSSTPLPASNPSPPARASSSATPTTTSSGGAGFRTEGLGHSGGSPRLSVDYVAPPAQTIKENV